ncbi:MAG TPA: HAMP domain-containing sensor histidine kinase [Acidimicrobiales bacterium]|nr:HAMP domain-containing sensor histidine kinase [Acidimicrobiales bacterium]
MSRSPRLGLRARTTLGFGLIGLVVSVVLAGLSYAVARQFLVSEREDAAIRQSYVNARLVRTLLRDPQPDVRSFLAGLGGGTASSSVLRYRGEWFSTSVAAGRDAIPADLLRQVTGGHAGRQRYRGPGGDLHLAVGVAVPAVDGAYFELFPLDELERTLDVLTRALSIGAAAAAGTAALLGYAAARQIVRPLQPVADAAEQIAEGRLDTRLDAAADPDLRRLVDAFNTMASSLEERIQREARFAADVSHEVRAPLAALSAAVDVIDRRRHQLPDQVLSAFEIMVAKVEGFQQMVLELLEISRIDAGAASLSLDRFDLRQLLERLIELHGQSGVEIRFEPGAPTHVVADRHRLGQALGNIMDNARRYAGGLVSITVDTDGDLVRIALDDDGPGVAVEERAAIFGRFARGDAGLRAGTTTGTGLGLALVAENIGMHGGKVRVEVAPGGGARFLVELPQEVE